MLLACAGTAETMAPMVHTGKASTCCKFIPVCDKSFLTTKEYAICRPPHQIEAFSLAMDKTETSFVLEVLRNRNLCYLKVFKTP